MSVFFPEAIRRVLRDAGGGKQYLESASWWVDLSYQELRGLVFSPQLERSWFVLSDGSCPACGVPVPMYDWIYEPKVEPWKMRCPHCKKRFPTNDFAAFYRSGLDSDGAFDRSVADRSLLLAPDGSKFGVDDGNGFVGSDGTRWRFISAYLVWAQWFDLIIGGVSALSFAYLLSGNVDCARRCAILLHQIARFFPDFDFKTQGVMYEEPGRSEGYVSYWGNSVRDLYSMAIAYDMISEALDTSLEDDHILRTVTGVSSKDICSTIRNRIFRDALANTKKYTANPPSTQVSQIVMTAVLEWPDCESRMLEMIGEMLQVCTRIEGLTGEKGLSGYAAIAPHYIAELLCLLGNLRPNYFEEMIEEYPVLRRTYRFHIDTWYQGRFYPGIGDADSFGTISNRYAGTHRINLESKPHVRSMDWFIWRLYELYDDPDFARALYLSNERNGIRSFENDLYIAEPESLQRKLNDAIDRHGTDLAQSTQDLKEWRLSLLYSGAGADSRLLCMNYDSGANHSHEDALNIGLFVNGRNLAPGFGYPPVHYGGWDSPRFWWYRRPPSHNLVVVDGEGHKNLAEGVFLRYPEYGVCTNFGEGSFAQVAVADAKEYAGTDRFERLVALVDTSERESYVIDVFRVSGGKDHTLFHRTPPAKVGTTGLSFSPGDPYGHGTFMRDFKIDREPAVDWSVRFDLDDLPREGSAVSDVSNESIALGYHGFTRDASVTLCESWIDVSRDSPSAGISELWIPTLMIRSTGPDTTFCAVIEPIQGANQIARITRHPSSIDRPNTSGDSSVVLEIEATNGCTDWIVIVDSAAKAEVRVDEIGLATDASFSIVRLCDDEVVRSAAYGATQFDFAGRSILT